MKQTFDHDPCVLGARGATEIEGRQWWMFLLRHAYGSLSDEQVEKCGVGSCSGAVGYAGSAAADEEMGFYAGVGLGQVTVENDEDGIDFDEDDTGFKLFGGYQFNKFIAIELAYIDGGEPNDSFTVGGIDVENEVEVTQVNAAAVGSFAFNEFVGAMGRLGLAYVDAQFKQTASGLGTTVDVDDDTTEFAYGVGVWFAPVRNFLLRLEYEMTSAELFDDDIDEDTDISLISVSAMYRFGQ